MGVTKRGKGCKIMAVADRTGLPVAIHVGSARPAELTLVPALLAARFTFTRALPTRLIARLIGDRGYDSDPLDRALAARGVELIAPHRRNRTKPKTQDGRPLRRYRRRWKVERLNAWLQNSRRVLVRHDRYLENYTGFVHLACVLILLRAFMR